MIFKCIGYRINLIYIAIVWVSFEASINGANADEDKKLCIYECHIDKKEETVYICDVGVENASKSKKDQQGVIYRPIPKAWILKFNGKASVIDITRGDVMYAPLSDSNSDQISVITLRKSCIRDSAADVLVKMLSKSAMKLACKDKMHKITTETSGTISSPKFPKPYPKRTQPITCRWRISTKTNNVLQIKFTKIDLESKSDAYPRTIPTEYERYRISHGKPAFDHYQDCEDGYVNITDPTGRIETTQWVHYGVFCGNWQAPPFMTVGNAVVINFIGSSSGSHVGFSLQYKAIKPPRGLNMVRVEEAERTNFGWAIARANCQKDGKDLCRTDDICRYGRPFYGVERETLWTPVLDEFDEWAQIGEAKGQTCQRHNPLFGPPQWVNSGNSSQTTNILYCCDPLDVISENELLTDDRLPAAHEVNVIIYTTVQNDRPFYRYIREGIDTIEDSSIWSQRKLYNGDLSNIVLYSAYKKGFSKVIYFCFKRLFPAIGQVGTVYAMFDTSCNLKEWKQSFYLYAADDLNADASLLSLYVGISSLRPYHSRVHFVNFPLMFQAVESFVIKAKTSDLIPSNIDQDQIATDADTITSCSSAIINITAPAIIMSPGYPKKYKPLMNCKWRVKLSRADLDLGVKLRITIEELELEDRSDFLTIYETRSNEDVDDLPYSAANEYTGISRSLTKTTTHSFLFHFKSDYSIERKGFKIIAEIVNDKCGGTVRTHGATIMTPGYPKNYKPKLHCSWEIQAPKGSGIEIQFAKFEVKQSDGCVKDYVTIEAQSLKKSERLCGVKTAPPRFEFKTRTVTLNFTSNSKKTKLKGFVFNAYFWPIRNLPENGTGGKECGVQKISPWPNSNERVVGGTESVSGSWPWLVYIPEAKCGGVLLRKRWVLTAAHCFAGEKAADGVWGIRRNSLNFTVVAGRHHRTAKSPREQVLQIKRIIMHPKFDRVRLGAAGREVPTGIPINDMALIKLEQAASLHSGDIGTICLPTHDVVVGESCVIAGWGARDFLATLADNFRDTLHNAHVFVLSNSLCNSYEALRGSVTDNMICAGYPGGGVDSCNGDSGGPLMCKGSGKGYQIKGVVSWGRGCGKPKQPGLYTRVYNFYEWISDTIS